MKTVVITGSTSGIGKELIKLFAGDCKVFAGYRNDKLLVPLDNVEYFYINMLDSTSISDAAEFIKGKTRNLDVIINVAGCVEAGPVEYISIDKLRQQFEVNTFSHIDFTQRLMPLLDGGRIINISSMASFGHFPFISPYCASKRALDIFFSSLSVENHKNIKVISIKPGVVATPIWEKSINANSETLENCSEYSKELEFLKNNALKNSDKGLDVIKVAEFIKNVALSNNPKASYTIGFDAKIAHILSYLPQDLINKIVRLGMKIRIK